MSHCTCGRIQVPPLGPANAEILLIGNAPTQFDVRAMKPWTGEAGSLLQSELRRAGINYNNVRITNMWQHAKTKDCDIVHHLDAVYAEMANKRYIILMGSDVVTYFTDMQVSDVSGLRIDNMDRLPPESKVYAIFNPAIAMRDKLGEVRHGLSKIAEDMKLG